MRRIVKFGLVSLGFAMSLQVCMAQNQKPNIVFILADDCTKYDLGCYGSKDSKTPTIDKLAYEGIKFNNCYQHAPMCSPTRHSIYTGMYPVKTGAFPNHTYVKEGVQSVAQYLKPLGYRVALSGKRHILPKKVFDFEYLEGSEKKELNPEMEKIDAFMFDATSKDDNFCLFVCSTEPHSPWNKGDTTLFVKEDITLPPNCADTPLTRESYRNYLAEINYLDEQVKQVMLLLKKHKVDDNTIVFFSSEQGNSFPFSKWTCYNVGLTSALIAWWPDRIEPGLKSDALVEYVDILPTMIDVAGGKEIESLDGKSLTGLFENPSMDHKKYTFGLQTTRGIFNGAEYYPIRSVSDGTFRLIMNLSPEMEFKNTVIAKDEFFKEWLHSSNPEYKALAKNYIKRPALELYNDKEDIYNQHNLIEDRKYSEKVDELKKELLRWMAECGDKGLETELHAFPHMRIGMNLEEIKVDMQMFDSVKNGNIKVDTQGYYTFYLKGEGKLFVDGKLLVESKITKSSMEYHGVIGLKPGGHVVEYHGSVEVFWSGPELNKQKLVL